MDPRLARVIYTLKVAAKLKKNNPEASDIFINKNTSYFPNKSDRLVEYIKSTKESTVKTEGFGDPLKNLDSRRDKINKIIHSHRKATSTENEIPSFVDVNYEKSRRDRNFTENQTTTTTTTTQQFKIPIVNQGFQVNTYKGRN